MKLRAIALLLMVFYDFSIHFVNVFNKVALHPLYPIFPLFGFIKFHIFWMIYYAIATLFALTLLGSGTTVKNKTTNITHVHNELPKIKKEVVGNQSDTPDTQ